MSNSDVPEALCLCPEIITCYEFISPLREPFSTKLAQMERWKQVCHPELFELEALERTRCPSLTNWQGVWDWRRQQQVDGLGSVGSVITYQPSPTPGWATPCPAAQHPCLLWGDSRRMWCNECMFMFLCMFSRIISPIYLFVSWTTTVSPVDVIYGNVFISVLFFRSTAFSATYQNEFY